MPPKENKDNLEEDSKIFYFDITHTVEQCKYEICEEFGIKDKEDIKQYLLYRLDHFDDPAHPIRKEKATFEKSHVRFGETIVLKNSKDAAGPGDQVKLNISLTTSGLPEDSTFIGILEVSVEQKLADARDMILNMDRF